MFNQYKSILRRSGYLFISLLATLGIISISNNAYATHAAGSDLTYRWISGNIYEVTVNFYRDCQGVAAPGSVTLNVKSTSCGQNFNVTLNPIAGTGQEITFPCNPTFTYCNGGTNPGIQQYTYRGNVTLPSQCVDWIFSYSVCCRNCAISTITNQANCNNSSTGNALYVEATLNNVAANHNSSPTFNNIPVAFVCVNQAFTFNHGVTDSNGDSLSYSFIAPKRSATVDVGFLAGFSATNWLTSAPPVAISATTGDITMLPTTVGQVAVCAVLVKEYRAGVLIGSVIRDMQFWIKDCGTNLLPTATGINGTSNFSTVICPGSSTCFTINSNDGNIGQHITMTSTSTTTIPGSTFTIANQGGASPNYPVGTFCWTPTALDARDQPYTFTVTVRDDNCNYNAFQIYSYSIVVPRHIITFVSPTYNGYHISCNGGSNGSVTANVSGNQAPITYHWSTGATTQTVSGLAAGTYGITITDVNGCTKDTTVTLTQPTAITLSVTSTAANCNGNTNATGTATPTGGIAPYTYLWSNAQTIQTATGLTGGVTYSVTVTDANGCTKTGSTTISQPAVLSASVTSSTNVSCNGQSTGAIDLSVTGGTTPYTYHWNNNATSQDISGLGAGTYFVTVTDAHGCTTIKSQVITQPGVIVPLISSTSINGVNVACYGDATGTASVSVTGGTGPFNYLWSNGATTSSLTGLTAGTVSVTVTDANGCLGNGSLTLSQPGGPIVITLDSLKDYNGFGTSCNG
ncbi:MAG: SprB repeat-containing protein, partial [Bacteroidota bacterium]